MADRLARDPRVSVKARRRRPLWGQALADGAGFFRLRPADLLVKTFSSGLMDKTADGRLRDVWFDDLIIAHGDALKIEGINNRALLPERKKALIPSVCTTTLLDLASQQLGRRIKWPREISTIATELSAAISAEFDVAMPVEMMRTVMANFLWQKRLYSAILARVRPKTIMVADFGEYGLVAAAKERGIRVFEVQHGIADRYHAAYAWTEDSAVNRPRMPVPDRLLLFGEYWKEELSASFWGKSLEVVGSARCDRYREIPRTSGTGRYRILVTADGIESIETIRMLKEFLDAARGVDVGVIVKLHPIFGESDAAIETAFSGEARVSTLRATEGESTFRLLRTVDLHASIASASHYDALGLGTPTVILGAGRYKTVENLHERGHASLVFNGAEMVPVLKRARVARVPELVSEFYFRSGAVPNVLALLS